MVTLYSDWAGPLTSEQSAYATTQALCWQWQNPVLYVTRIVPTTTSIVNSRTVDINLAKIIKFAICPVQSDKLPQTSVKSDINYYFINIYDFINMFKVSAVSSVKKYINIKNRTENC